MFDTHSWHDMSESYGWLPSETFLENFSTSSRYYGLPPPLESPDWMTKHWKHAEIITHSTVGNFPKGREGDKTTPDKDSRERGVGENWAKREFESQIISVCCAASQYALLSCCFFALQTFRAPPTLIYAPLFRCAFSFKAVPKWVLFGQRAQCPLIHTIPSIIM